MNKNGPPTSGRVAAGGAPKETVASPAGRNSETNGRTFRICFDLPGKTDDSRFKGTIIVTSSGRKVF